MLFPSKVIPYSESVLAKFPLVLRYLENGPKKIRDVYKHMHGEVSDISELFEVLDSLYALGAIDISEDNLLIIDRGSV